MTLKEFIPIFHYVINWFAYLIIFVILINLIYAWLPLSRDDSDQVFNNGKKGKRSDLKVYTDYKTGIQYLGTTKGTLIPRIYPDGTYVVVEPNGVK
jgi:hypothetical protein